MSRTALAILLVVTLGVSSYLTATAQQDADGVKGGEIEVKKREVNGRLPAYYSQIVDNGQRQRIYQIQTKYNDQIEALVTQIDALTV